MPTMLVTAETGLRSPSPKSTFWEDKGQGGLPQRTEPVAVIWPTKKFTFSPNKLVKQLMFRRAVGPSVHFIIPGQVSSLAPNE